jgi:hypothetical protein
MGYLILRVSKERDGRDTADLFSMRYRLGEPLLVDIARLAGRHGCAVHSVIGCRRGSEWPWTVFAYTSKRRDGFGRSGSSIQAWHARPIICSRCRGTGRLYRDGVTTKACSEKGCRGTGRIHQGGRTALQKGDPG